MPFNRKRKKYFYWSDGMLLRRPKKEVTDIQYGINYMDICDGVKVLYKSLIIGIFLFFKLGYARVR